MSEARGDVSSDVSFGAPERAAEYAAARATLARDGVVCVRAAFDEFEMRRVDAAFQWTMDNPGPGASKRYTFQPGTFFETTGHSPQAAPYIAIFEHTRIRALLRALYGGRPAWYLGEQLFHKEGDSVRRTPWHQDLSYLNYSGDSVLGVWMSLGDLPKAACLEFVRGSHKGPLYNGASYIDPDDDTHPLYPDTTMPRRPRV